MPLSVGSRVRYSDVNLCWYRGVIVSVSGRFAMVRWAHNGITSNEWIPNLALTGDK